MEMYSDEDYSSPEEGSDSEAMGDQDHLYNRHPVVTRPRPRSRKGRERSSISQSAVARQRNIKQKFVALLKKFKVTEEHGGPHGLNRDLDLTAGLATNSIIFCFPFCKKSLICLEGKSMTPHRGNAILFCSSQQLPRLRLGPSKGFLS